MTKKSKRFLLYTKGTALGLFALAACSEKNTGGDEKHGPLKAKTEKAIVDLRTQNNAAIDVNTKIQNAFQATSRAETTPMTIEEMVVIQQQTIDILTGRFDEAHALMTTGEHAIFGFDRAAQNYANTTPLNLKDTRHRITIYHELSAGIIGGTNPDISMASLTAPQKTNLEKFKTAAYNLEYAMEIMARLTGGVERAQQQIGDTENWIHDLSMEIVGILESATGQRVRSRTDSGEPLPTETILQNAEALMATMSEEDLAPYSAEIDRITRDIEHVQAGLDGLLKFWDDLAKTTGNSMLAQAKPAKHQQELAKNFATKKMMPVKMAKNTRTRA